MSKKLIRKVFFAGPYDLKAVEEYLEEMAANGFMFVKQKGIFYYFDECEPKKVRFAVDIFDKASMFDTRPEAKTEEYIAYCEECGWQFLYTNGKIQFFYTEENPVPIQTDSTLKMKWIKKYVLQARGVLWIYSLFMLVNLVLQIITNASAGNADFNMVERYIVGANGNITGLVLCALFLFIVIDFLRYVRFATSNQKRIKEGLSIEYYSRKQTNRYYKGVFLLSIFAEILLILNMMAFNVAFGIGLLLFVLIITGVSYGTEAYRQGNRKLKRFDNIMITIVVCGITGVICIVGMLGMMLQVMMGGFDRNVEKITYYDEELEDEVVELIYHDDVPLTMDDLGLDINVARYSQTDADEYHSIFGTYKTYSHLLLDGGDSEEIYPDLCYEILECKWDKMRQSYIEDYLDLDGVKGKEISEKEKEQWNARQVYGLYDEDGTECGRLVIYENRVIYIYSYWIDYSEEQIEVMKEKLAE